MITIRQKGDFSKTTKFFQRALETIKLSDLDYYGRKGVEALSSATPQDTGETAKSWEYRIEHKKGSIALTFYNTNTTEDGIPIAILIQYGHVTGNGGYVQGRDYINPAIQPIFDEIANTIWKEVTSK